MKGLKGATMVIGLTALVLSFASNAISDSVTWTDSSTAATGTTRGFKSPEVQLNGLGVTGSGVSASLTIGSASTAVAYWNLDGSANDSSGGGHNGTLYGTPAWVAGKATAFGQALSFDGVNDYVDFGDIADLNSTSKFTIEAWMKQDNNTAFHRIMGKTIDGNNDILISTYSNALYLEVGSGANTGAYWTAYAATIPSGQWFHFAAVFDGSKSNAAERGKIYINGVERSVTAMGTYPSATANLAGRSFYIGSAFDGHYFAGAIDELRIYKEALSAGEVAAHAAAASPF